MTPTAPSHRAASVAVALSLALLLAAPGARARDEGPWGVAYGPADPATPKPAIVFLHGMWASPEDSCEPFGRAGTSFGFVVCPRANAPLGDAGSGHNYKMWSGSYVDAARSIRAALDAADGLAPGKRAPQGGTLLGFSNGAYFAAEVACSEPGRWTGLVLMSMKLDLDPKRLQHAGINRVVLAAGDRDEARDSMKSLAARLQNAGVETRFMSLGDVGHAFPADMADRMCSAIAWVRSEPESACSAAASPPP